MSRKTWLFKDIKLLIYLNKKNCPAKLLGKIFDVSPNAINKSLQRYSTDYLNPLDKKIPIIYDWFESLRSWIEQRWLLFKDIVLNHNISWVEKTININKIFNTYGLPYMNYYQLQNIFYKIIINFKSHMVYNI